MKRLFVCFVLFIQFACQSEEKKSEFIVECPMPHCDDNPSLWMSAEACVTMLLDERFERCYVEPFKPDQNVQIGCQGQNCKKVGVVEFLEAATSPLADKPSEVAPQPSKDDQILSDCLSSVSALVSVRSEKQGSKQKQEKSEYMFVRDVFAEEGEDLWWCIDTMTEFLTVESEERIVLFPVSVSSSVSSEDVRANLQQKIRYKTRLLLELIQLDITPSPFFFTRGNGVLGRHNLVNEVFSLLHHNDFFPQDLQAGLSMEKLFQWKKRGIREFYAWWKHKWTDSDVRSRIHHDLCIQISCNGTSSCEDCLTEKQVESLKCGKCGEM